MVDGYSEADNLLHMLHIKVHKELPQNWSVHNIKPKQLCKKLIHQKFLCSFLLILTQTQILTLKLTPNLTLTQALIQILILTLKKEN